MPDGALVAGRLRERGRVAEPRKREGHVLAAEGVGVVFAHGGLCRSVCGGLETFCVFGSYTYTRVEIEIYVVVADARLM